jgi:hypothetical protein
VLVFPNKTALGNTKSERTQESAVSSKPVTPWQLLIN